jgi:hypothetical protein
MYVIVQSFKLIFFLLLFYCWKDFCYQTGCIKPLLLIKNSCISLRPSHILSSIIHTCTKPTNAYWQLMFYYIWITTNISNKSPTKCNSFPVYYPDVYLQLNMFRAFFRPSSGAQWLQEQPRRAMFVVGPAGPTTKTARPTPRYKGKTRGCDCSHWAPDDGRDNARNMLSCK